MMQYCMREQGKLSMQLLLTTLSVVGGRAMQVWTSAQFARARVSSRISVAENYPCSFPNRGMTLIRCNFTMPHM